MAREVRHVKLVSLVMEVWPPGPIFSPNSDVNFGLGDGMKAK
jgi:hypothetical protein